MMFGTVIFTSEQHLQRVCIFIISSSMYIMIHSESEA